MSENKDALRDKWKMVDADCRDGNDGLITHHVSAFDEGFNAARLQDQKRIVMLVDWISHNGEHNQKCGIFDLDDNDCHCACTCGFDDAISDTQKDVDAFIMDVREKAQIGLLREMIEDLRGVDYDGSYWAHNLQAIIDIIEEESKKRKQATQAEEMRGVKC